MVPELLTASFVVAGALASGSGQVTPKPAAPIVVTHPAMPDGSWLAPPRLVRAPTFDHRTPQPAAGELDRASASPLVVCGMTVWQAPANVDPKIVAVRPDQTTDFKIRKAVPSICTQ